MSVPEAAPDCRVVHLVAADLSTGRCAALRQLLHDWPAANPPAIICVGRRAGLAREFAAHHPRTAHVTSPLNLPALGTRALRNVITRLAETEAPHRPRSARLPLQPGHPPADTPPAQPTPPRLLHAWSPDAFAWAVALCGLPPYTIIAEVESGDERRVSRDYDRLREYPRTPGAPAAVFACRGPALRRLRSAGVPDSYCVLVPECLEIAPPAPEQTDLATQQHRAGVRQKFGLDPDNHAVLVLPPISKPAGSFHAVWAGLLVEKVRPELRLLVPAARRGGNSGRELARIRRLVHSARHEYMVRFLPPDLPLAEALSMADYGLYLPEGAAPQTGLLSALAAGLPAITTAASAFQDELGAVMDQGGGSSAVSNLTLCPPHNPRAAAAALLAGLDNLFQARRHAAILARHLQPLRDTQQVARTYARIYTQAARAAAGPQRGPALQWSLVELPTEGEEARRTDSEPPPAPARPEHQA